MKYKDWSPDEDIQWIKNEEDFKPWEVRDCYW